MQISETRVGRTEEVPNNPELPLRLYQRAVEEAEGEDSAAAFETMFARNGWPPEWRSGVFTYQHYHSNSHEVLGVAQGRAEIQFGGPEGPVVEVAAGDAVWIPAGVAHKRLESSDDFLVVGAYPDGSSDHDLCRPEDTDAETAAHRIAAVAMPERDPVTGATLT